MTRGHLARARALPDTVLSPLPPWFVRTVFLLLPVDTRLRCCDVNRAWRALLADTTFWACINFATDSGVARFSLPLLRAAAAKAGGQLRVLDITRHWLQAQDFLLFDRLVLETVIANAASLTELRVNTTRTFCPEQVRLLVEAGVALQSLEVSLFTTQAHHVTRVMLRNEPPYQALRMRELTILRGITTVNSTEQVIAFCSDLRRHASLEHLQLDVVALNTAVKMGAFADACISLRLRSLNISSCIIGPDAVPELTRLVAAGALRHLRVDNDIRWQVFDEAHESTRLFVAAVRASAMTALLLEHFGNLPESVVEVAAFINARQ